MGAEALGWMLGQEGSGKRMLRPYICLWRYSGIVLGSAVPQFRSSVLEQAELFSPPNSRPPIGYAEFGVDVSGVRADGAQ